MARELSLGQSTTASRLRQFSIQPEGFAHLWPQAFARHFRTMAENECRCTGCDVSDGTGGARQTTQRLTFNSWIAQLIQDSGMIMGDHGKGNGKAAQRSAKETEAVGAATGGVNGANGSLSPVRATEQPFWLHRPEDRLAREVLRV